MQTTGRSGSYRRRYRNILVLTAAVTALTGWATGVEGAYTFTNLGPADEALGSIGVTTSGVSVNNQAVVEIAATTNTRATYSVGGGANSLAKLGGVNPPALSQSFGTSDGGVIVGSILSATGGGDQAFYTTGTTTAFTTLGTLGGASGDAYAVNRSAGSIQIVGKTTYSGQQQRAFTWTQSTGMVGLDSAGATGLGNTNPSAISSADAVNPSGLIAGFAENPGNVNRGFLYVPSKLKMYDLGSVAGTTGNSQANGINTAGLIVGQTDVNSTYSQAFVYSGYNTLTLPGSGTDVSLGGTIKALGAFDGTNSDALAVNDTGLVVGWSSIDPNGDTHAFLYNSSLANPTLQDLNSLTTLPVGLTLDEATGINTVGDITGLASTSAGTTYAFLLTPTSVPEPATVGLVMLAALSVVSNRRRIR